MVASIHATLVVGRRISRRRRVGREWWLGRIAPLVRGRQPEGEAAYRNVPEDLVDVGRAGTASNDFEAFFQRHQQRIYGYLLRTTGDEQAAHDLSQETFLRAWRHFERVSAYEAPAGWLFRVATNLALTHLRRRSRPAGTSVSLDAEGPARSDPALRIVELDVVRRTLMELAPKQRAALVLREVYCLSCEEVGQALGVSRDAAKMLLLRARERFRACYEREGGPR